MYRPNLRPGEELVKVSPGVNVKNVTFDAFLTNRRIIFVKQTDSIPERKELVFPLNLVRDYQPSSDESGTPAIRFSIEKPSGEVGDLILKFIQTGDYRYAERDDWIEDLKSVSRGIVPRHSQEGQNVYSGGAPPPGAAPFTPEIHNRNADIFSTGPENPYAPQSPEFRQPPRVPHAEERYSAPQDFRQSPRPEAPAEERYSMQQGFSQPAPSQPSYPSATAAGGVQSSFCRFCGAKVPSGSVFCPSCGGKVEQKSEMRQQSFQEAPVQRSQPDRQSFTPPPPPRQQPGFGDQGFVNPPSHNSSGRGGYGQQHGYPPRDGGMSLADDRAYGYGQGGQFSPKGQKSMMKEQAKADKARMKEQARAEKERQKAMKRAQKGRGYNDPYGYKESRMPEPKVIIIAIAVIAVIAVAGYAFSSGMIGGGGSTSAGGDSQSPSSSGSSSSSSSGSSSSGPLGQTTKADSYGDWFFEVLYSGDWSGTYSYNGQSYSISGFGYQQSPSITNPSGTISISIHKDDGESGKVMDVTLYDAKGVAKKSVTSSTNSGETVTLDYTVN